MSKRYAVSDLHGQLPLLKLIQEYINDDDVVYALGDFGDRGIEPWQTIKAALDDPRFIYLMGNHDLMLVNAIKEYLKEGMDFSRLPKSFNDPFAALCMNKGKDTIHQWAREPERRKYYEKLCNLPVEIRLAAKDGEHIICLTHAGYGEQTIGSESLEDFVWNREHLYGSWINPHNHLLIHGHTPIMYFNQLYPKIKVDTSKGYALYDNGSKIDIDMGSCVTNQTILLDIDTLEGRIFKYEGGSNA